MYVPERVTQGRPAFHHVPRVLHLSSLPARPVPNLWREGSDAGLRPQDAALMFDAFLDGGRQGVDHLL
jgi:hypothetical protein